METKTVNIEIELFKELKIICAKNDLKIKEFVENAIKNELKKLHDNN